MQYGNLVGYSGASVRKIPRGTFERFKMLIRKEGMTVESRLLFLIKQDLKQNWTDELERQFNAVYSVGESKEE